VLITINKVTPMATWIPVAFTSGST
jgi:hypothetical protein